MVIANEEGRDSVCIPSDYVSMPMNKSDMEYVFQHPALFIGS